MHREAWEVLPSLLKDWGAENPVLIGHSDGATIALLWRIRELPEDLASYGPLPGLLSAAASLLLEYSAARLWPSLCCCVLFTASFLLQSFSPLLFLYLW
jgi:pimeloyl-ACP methyl ester carboxylesterase